MTQLDIICEMCTRWQLVQDVERDEPRERVYVIYTNFMQCEKGHTHVINRSCEDFYAKGEK